MHISCRCFYINIKPVCKTQPNEMRGRYLSTFCKCPGVTVLLVFILLLISGVSGHCRVQAYQGEEFTQSHTEETQQWLYTVYAVFNCIIIINITTVHSAQCCELQKKKLHLKQQSSFFYLGVHWTVHDAFKFLISVPAPVQDKERAPGSQLNKWGEGFLCFAKFVVVGRLLILCAQWVYVSLGPQGSVAVVSVRMYDWCLDDFFLLKT